MKVARCFHNKQQQILSSFNLQGLIFKFGSCYNSFDHHSLFSLPNNSLMSLCSHIFALFLALPIELVAKTTKIRGEKSFHSILARDEAEGYCEQLCHTVCIETSSSHLLSTSTSYLCARVCHPPFLLFSLVFVTHPPPVSLFLLTLQDLPRGRADQGSQEALPETGHVSENGRGRP